MSDSNLAAVIIAGGHGTRMGGRDKAFLEVDGRTIIDGQLEVLRTLTSEIAISTNAPERFERFLLPTLKDSEGEKGPLAGLAAGLRWTTRSHVLALACDMPSTNRELLELIASKRSEAEIVAPRLATGPEPLIALYSTRCLASVAARLASGRRSARGFLLDAESEGLSVRWIEESEIRTVDPSLRSFVNVNSPRDLP